MSTGASRPILGRRQIVRRLPTRADLLERKPMVVTARDRRILAALADFGFLSTEIIVRAFFPGTDGDDPAPDRAALARLRLLWLWSLVERIELPVARVFGGRRPFLYAVGPSGVAWVPERRATGEGPVQRPRLDRLDERLLDHDLTVAAFWAHLVAGLRGSRAIPERWVSERTLRTWREQTRAIHRGGVPLTLPDGIAEIRYPDDTFQCCVLEVDLGTETLRRFARKVRGFEAYRTGGWFPEHFGYDSFEVIVLCPSDRRRDHLRRVAGEIVSCERWGAYRFGTFAALAGTSAGEPSWVDLTNHWSPLLDSDAGADRTGGA
jgi:Replication-relaxation